MFVVTFLPFGVSVSAGRGDTILDVALDHGVSMGHECGGNCACTTCHIRVISGAEHLSPMETVERERLATANDRTPQSRLACQALVQSGPVTVQVVEVED